ncbi:MAG: hypothetical protein J1F40_02470 [Prevotellaceae bacterium]|nr:hypothetical protein [Prevotellaceae bacterium]
MNKILVMVATATTLLLSSCGTSKKTPSTDYQYQQWRVQQEQQQSAQQRPSRTIRERVQSIVLASEDCDKWRAYGTATSYVEKAAISEARRMAREELAQMMKVAIEGAAQDYTMNAQQNLKGSAETLAEEVMSLFVSQEIENSKEIWNDTFDLSDGSIQVYVCYEIRSSKEDFNKKLDNTLDREGIIGIQYDRDRFIKQMSAGLEEYKKKNQAQ